MNPPLPIGAYRNKIQGVPLTGGQNSGTISGYPGATGSVTSPAANQAVAGPVTVAVTGTYTVKWTVSLAGTLGAGDASNFGLLKNGVTLLAVSSNPAAAGSYPQASFTTALNAGDTLVVEAGGGATTGSVYGATLPAVAPPLTLSVGPQGLGSAWYPAQVILSTSTGSLDTSTALVYLGVGGVPTTLVGQVFSGNGILALAVPPMQAGDLLLTTWQNGHPGDVASMNVIGTMDALTTGRG
jgi:hypothetical protein